MVQRVLPQVGSRFRVLCTRVLGRLGFAEETFLLLPAVIIGIAAAAGAVAFHELINLIRHTLYASWSADYLYGRGIWLLVLWPTLGGLVVGILSRLFGAGGHGVPEVIESVIRTQGFIKPSVGVQKIITASATIGSGGSAGAEGPIVQVGAAIASGVGQLFRIARQHMPILVGCGTAAGISAIFNSPIGGVLFTLEVILQDFSIRAFTPLMIASVVANVTTRAIFQGMLQEQYHAIFAIQPDMITAFGAEGMLTWAQLPNFALLGIGCGVVAAALTALMAGSEKRIARLPVPRVLRPALGGLAVGLMGLIWVIVGGRLLGSLKPFPFSVYPEPAFFGDGYGIVLELLRHDYYVSLGSWTLIVLLAMLCAAKLVATSLTLSTGGSGGVIAPSLLLGATIGAALGIFLQKLGVFSSVFPEMYALVGMGAVLGAVVHAPLAAILILLELTSDYRIIMPAMLATICAVGASRFLQRDSIYARELRAKGIRIGSSRDASLLRRLTIEQIGMEPALLVKQTMTLKDAIAAMGESVRDAVVVSTDAAYVGVLRRQDIETALLQPDSIPLLLCGELARADVPILASTDDLSRAMEAFANCDTHTLAVSLSDSPRRVVGVVSQQFLVKRYHDVLDEQA